MAKTQFHYHYFVLLFIVKISSILHSLICSVYYYNLVYSYNDYRRICDVVSYLDGGNVYWISRSDCCLFNHNLRRLSNLSLPLQTNLKGIFIKSLITNFWFKMCNYTFFSKDGQCILCQKFLRGKATGSDLCDCPSCYSCYACKVSNVHVKQK